MPQPRAFRTRLAALALLLPLALAAAAAAEGTAAGGASAPTGGAAAGAPGKAATPPPAQEKSPDPGEQVARGITGLVLLVTKETIAVQNLAEGSGGRSTLTLAAGADTKVTGVKKSFADLRKGDLVAVSYQGDPPAATGIQVLPPSLDPRAAAALGIDLYQKPGREFIGWIKRVDAHQMVVRTPNAPPPSKRKGEVKTFVRQPDTVVTLLRSSWDELKKGDRVSVDFAKGEPRPAKRVQVILRGGEKPLPPGLATRLYDGAYDTSVKDVDGIGEWPPGAPWPSQDANAAPGAASPPAPAR